MALANLNINVNANIANAISGMHDVKSASHESMAASSASVVKFQQDVERSAKAINQSSASISTEMDSAKESVKEFAASRVVIAAVGITLGAAAAAAAGLGYAAYKASGFVAGLITGETYKSKNIDALIATDKEVRVLQESLQLTAQDATALHDALQRIGVNKSDVSDTYGKLESKLHTGDTAEMDRLGVAWKDKSPEEVIGNAVKVLDQYTEGWDRNQAAVALGLGSYTQMTNYLKVNQAEVQKSKDRLNEYNLEIGPETQKYVDQYQAAMLEFKNETRLMGESLSRVWADQVMPAYTALANMLKDGWPSIVNGVRHIVAAFTSLGYGIKMSFDMVYDSLEGIFKAVGGGFAAVAAAIEQVMHGNFTGAREVLIAGWNDTKKSIVGITDEIVKDANKNLNAMKLAQGQFNHDSTPAGQAGSGNKKGKTWNPAPTEEDDDPVKDYTSLWARIADKYMEYLKSFNTTKAEKIKAAAALELQVNQQAWDWGLIDLKTYLDKKHSLSEKELQDEIDLKKKEVEMYGKKVTDNTKGALTDHDVKAAAAYTDALKKQQDATTDLTKLEGRLAELKGKNRDEGKRGIYDQTAGLSSLNIQLMEVTGHYVEAAKARAEFEKQSPEYKKLSPAEQAEKDKLNQLAIKQAGINQKKDEQQQKGFMSSLQFGAGGDNPFGKPAYQYGLDQIEQQYQERLISAEQFYGKDAALSEQYGKAKEQAAMERDRRIKQFEKQTWDNRIGAIGDSLGQIGQIMMKGNKDQFEAGKALAIASAIVNTYMAASAAFAGITASTGGWGVAVAAVAAAAAVATGMAQVAAIESTQYQGREMGGPVRAGQSYIVGEKRPELFTPGASGFITPYVPGGGGQNVDVTNVYQISTGVTETVRSEIMRAIPAITNAAVGAVKSAMRAGEFQGVAA